MDTLQDFAQSQLAQGRSFFSKLAAMDKVRQGPKAMEAATTRLLHKGRLISPKQGFYLILRPEDRLLGAPDPAKWIDPLMKHLGVDYRVSLLRAAAFHGSSHQAAMVFQVIAPKQIADIEIGRQRVQFLYQAPHAFENTNRSEWLSQLKTEAGFAKVAGVELTLLDMCRYFHRAGGINGAAQVVHDIGAKARSSLLAEAAGGYENAVVRRLGYLLDHFGHERQAKSLARFATKAKSFKALDPAIKPLPAELGSIEDRNAKWKIVINTKVEIDV